MNTQTAKHTPSSHHTRTTSLLMSTSLNSADFAPFGDVMAAREAESRGLRSVQANQGSARKWLNVTNLHDFYDECGSGEKAEVVVNLFVCEPRELERQGGRMVFPVNILERHPFTAQMFVPVGVGRADENVRYLVIVAPTLPASNDDTSTALKTAGPARKGPGQPDLDNIKAYLAHGNQAVSYGAGTWHAPMVVLGEKPIGFIVVQYSNGVASEDCQEFEIAAEECVAVDVGEADGSRAKL